TRSRLSRTAAAGRPTRAKLGRPGPRCTSTSTTGAVSPTCARLATRATCATSVARTGVARTFQCGDLCLERFEPRAGALEHARLRIEFVARDEIEPCEVGAQHGAEIGFQVALQRAHPGGERLQESPGEFIDRNAFHFCPQLTHGPAG